MKTKLNSAKKDKLLVSRGQTYRIEQNAVAIMVKGDRILMASEDTFNSSESKQDTFWIDRSDIKHPVK